MYLLDTITDFRAQNRKLIFDNEINEENELLYPK